MTEDQWNTCAEPTDMLDFLRRSDRRLRLFACAAVRRTYHVLDERSLKAVEDAERFADGLASEAELRTAREAGLQAAKEKAEGATPIDYYQRALRVQAANAAALATHKEAWWAAATSCVSALRAAGIEEMISGKLREPERAHQCQLVRDILGNPFHPTPAIEPSLLTPSILALANQVYEDRSFNRLPELADALASAGFTGTEVLEHLRGRGPHVRGCWALDAVLGKS